MQENYFYSKAILAQNKAYASLRLQKILLWVERVLLLTAGACALGVVVFYFIGISALTWVFAILAVLILLQIPLLIIGQIAFQYSHRQQSRECQKNMQTACLHGEADWQAYPGGARFFQAD